MSWMTAVKRWKGRSYTFQSSHYNRYSILNPSNRIQASRCLWMYPKKKGSQCIAHKLADSISDFHCSLRVPPERPVGIAKHRWQIHRPAKHDIRVPPGTHSDLLLCGISKSPKCWSSHWCAMMRTGISMLRQSFWWHIRGALTWIATLISIAQKGHMETFISSSSSSSSSSTSSASPEVSDVSSRGFPLQTSCNCPKISEISEYDTG